MVPWWVSGFLLFPFALIGENSRLQYLKLSWFFLLLPLAWVLCCLLRSVRFC